MGCTTLRALVLAAPRAPGVQIGADPFCWTAAPRESYRLPLLSIPVQKVCLQNRANMPTTRPTNTAPQASENPVPILFVCLPSQFAPHSHHFEPYMPPHLPHTLQLIADTGGVSAQRGHSAHTAPNCKCASCASTGLSKHRTPSDCRFPDFPRACTTGGGDEPRSLHRDCDNFNPPPPPTHTTLSAFMAHTPHHHHRHPWDARPWPLPPC